VFLLLNVQATWTTASIFISNKIDAFTFIAFNPTFYAFDTDIKAACYSLNGLLLIILKTVVEHIPTNKNQHKLDKEN
jgi:hypothetical protein